MNLFDHGVQVWAINISQIDQSDKNFEKLIKLVDPESEFHIRKFYRRQDAFRCLMGRLLSRAIASSIGHVKWSNVKFAKEQNGRPYITEPFKTIDLNVAHDSDWVVCGFIHHGDLDLGSRIGIDVMKIRIPWSGTTQDFLNTLNDQLSENEYSYIKNLHQDSDKIHSLMQLWTHKEALSKAYGTGLSSGFSKWDFIKSLDKIPTKDDHIHSVANSTIRTTSVNVASFDDSTCPNDAQKCRMEWLSILDPSSNDQHLISLALLTSDQVSESSATNSTRISSWLKVLSQQDIEKYASSL